MIKKLLAVALALGSVAAHASLTPLAVWNANMPSLNGVQFNTATNVGGTTAMLSLGAHPYVDGVTMANDGVSTFYAPGGISSSNPNRANWSFDFAYNLGNCTGCSVVLRIDTDPSASASYVNYVLTTDASPDHVAADGTRMDSWNLLMNFSQNGVGTPFPGFSFNANAASITDFQLVLMRDGQRLGDTAITVEVPEPGSLALAGMALAALGFAARRRKA